MDTSIETRIADALRGIIVTAMKVASDGLFNPDGTQDPEKRLEMLRLGEALTQLDE